MKAYLVGASFLGLAAAGPALAQGAAAQQPVGTAAGNDQTQPVDTEARIRQLEAENRELRRSNEILRSATAFFAKAEFDRPQRCSSPSSTRTSTAGGSNRSAVS